MACNGERRCRTSHATNILTCQVNKEDKPRAKHVALFLRARSLRYGWRTEHRIHASFLPYIAFGIRDRRLRKHMAYSGIVPRQAPQHCSPLLNIEHYGRQIQQRCGRAGYEPRPHRRVAVGGSIRRVSCLSVPEANFPAWSGRGPCG